jgi:hypothetical protein
MQPFLFKSIKTKNLPPEVTQIIIVKTNVSVREKLWLYYGANRAL